MALTSNLLSYWKLDETSSTTVEDIHGTHDGTATSSAVMDASSGKLNYCAHFTGSATGIIVTDADNTFRFNSNEDHSFSFWQ